MRNEKDDFFADILSTFKSHFGNAAKAFWVYDGELCPCCLTQPIDIMIYKGKKALSVNAFMYRERGVLIAYLLCGQCAESIMAQSKNGPTSMHTSIEKNLINAYLHHMDSLNA